MKKLILISLAMLSMMSTQAKNQTENTEKKNWTFTRGLTDGTRGGTTQGVPVTYSTATTDSWRAVRADNISEFERDRRAILALAGEYQANFEFIETMLLDTNLDFDTPYASWGTEFIKVVEDRGDFIALQHILVMKIKDPNTGDIIGPYVVKHWRQDWTWNPTEQLVFQGDNHWKVKKLSAAEGQGKWKWTVYQVDDTPRYSMLGSWNHLASASIYNSEFFSRPLPRREFSVRSDYKLLYGTDSIVLTPNSWYHEQRNFKHKTKLGADNNPSLSPLLAREIGHNSYKRIVGFDFTIGYDYWNKSRPYWSDVVDVWREIYASRDDVQMKKRVGGKMLWQIHFANAEDDTVLAMSQKKRKQYIRNLLNNFIK
ncbi:MAG: hypothetical protein CME69_02740 [Halobacteriovorax sp.]|nr:hypothetical protein [Halobacteriovorax sp.]